ncbi:MAG: bifunctional metallophosphatase/5'-nucleotidase [Armatimonadota bacterium]
MRSVRSLLVSFVLFCVAVPLWPVPLRILATGDMHGWIQSQQVDGRMLGGAAEMLGYWKSVERYKPRDFLVISCGDIATGPDISTVFQGDPVIEVMNYMGYDVSAFGNHEFDFGTPRYKAWQETAKFPFLAANLVKADGNPSDLALPYLLYEEQGVKVGIIGLTTREIASIAITGGQVAKPYAETLRKYVPEVRAKGAQVVIVAAHAPLAELTQLATAVADLNIPLMLGGHSHELGQMKIGNTWVVNNGRWWEAYTRLDLDVDVRNGKTVVLTTKQVWMQQTMPLADVKLKNLIGGWQQRMNAEYRTPIGYAASGIKREWGIYNFVTDCWVEMIPNVDVALSNYGGFRQDIPTGPVTKGLIIGVMPFTNSLYRLTLSGEQLQAYLQKEGLIGMAGVRKKAGQYVLAKTGEPLDAKATYHVVVNSYMYLTSAALQAAHPQADNIVSDWRVPVYEWLAKHPTSKEHPLESVIDTKNRVTQ